MQLKSWKLHQQDEDTDDDQDEDANDDQDGETGDNRGEEVVVKSREEVIEVADGRPIRKRRPPVMKRCLVKMLISYTTFM